MWRWYTAEDRRQAAAVGALLFAASAVILCLGPVIAGLLITRLMRSESTAGLTNWPTVIIQLVRQPGIPAQAFGVEQLSPVLFWSLSFVLLLSLGLACAHLMKHGFQVLGPTGTGFAGRNDVSRELSVSACRQRAAVTRPDLTRRQIRRSAPSAVGIPLHQAAVSRSDLWLPLENATGVIAPQQSGKSLMDLIHKALAAPGGLIVTSTKLDLFLYTALARERADSPVQVLDLTGAVA